MNHIRKNELEKIKSRRKRKVQFINEFSLPRSQVAFDKHIEATKSLIEKSRFQDYLVGNSRKLALGIFDNAVCSRNLDDIFKPDYGNKMIALKRDHQFKVPQEEDNYMNCERDFSVEETIRELSEKCSGKLKIYQTDSDRNKISQTMLNLKLAKSESKLHNRLCILDNIQPCHPIDKYLGESRVPNIIDKFKSCPNIDLEQTSYINHLSLSTSTSISNARIYCRQSGSSCLNEYGSRGIAVHPLWDTPEQLRTSFPSSFTDRSILDKTLVELNESKCSGSFWVG